LISETLLAECLPAKTLILSEDVVLSVKCTLCGQSDESHFLQSTHRHTDALTVCRNCQHTDAAERNLVFVNDQRPPNVSAEVTADVTKDPTLPRTHQCLCTNCQHTEAVFFQAVTRGDEGMKLIFMCTKCANTSPLPPTQPSPVAMNGTLLTRVFLTCALQVCVPMGAIARALRPDFTLSR
jgi:DNA-directed RNA polymerase subunit M/transcription elongation factor TFIIS